MTHAIHSHYLKLIRFSCWCSWSVVVLSMSESCRQVIFTRAWRVPRFVVPARGTDSPTVDLLLRLFVLVPPHRSAAHSLSIRNHSFWSLTKADLLRAVSLRAWWNIYLTFVSLSHLLAEREFWLRLPVTCRIVTLVNVVSTDSWDVFLVALKDVGSFNSDHKLGPCWDEFLLRVIGGTWLYRFRNLL